MPLLATASHSAELLDLSMSVLRLVSPINIEYLQNMGVGASMSILRDGKLWGLFATIIIRRATFRSSDVPPPNCSGSWILEGRERESAVAYEGRARQIQERLMESAASHGSGQRPITEFIADYRKMIECDGIAVWSEGEITRWTG